MKINSVKSKILTPIVENNFSDVLEIQSEIIAKQLFLGILGREADEVGLQAYKEAICEHQSLVPAIQGLIESGEFSARAVALSAPHVVDALYLGILGRKADDEGRKNYIDLLQSGKSLEEIILVFRDASGDTGREGLRDLLQPMMSLHHGQMVNEYEGSEEQLRAISSVIKKTWEYLGAERAHHSVITDDSFLPESLDGNITDFWKTGDAEVDVLEDQLRRHGIDFHQVQSCVEYGCGVGRITIPLAQRIKSVHAYDISKDHLRYAEDRAGEVGVTNCYLHLVSDPFEPLEKCDLFYSRIVFQHNPPPIIHQLIKNALSSLNPGGVAVFQVPTYIVRYSFTIDDWLKREHAMDMQMHCIPQEAVFTLAAEHDCSILEVREDNSCGDPSLYLSNTFVIKKNKVIGSDDRHSVQLSSHQAPEVTVQDQSTNSMSMSWGFNRIGIVNWHGDFTTMLQRLYPSALLVPNDSTPDEVAALGLDVLINQHHLEINKRFGTIPYIVMPYGTIEDINISGWNEDPLCIGILDLSHLLAKRFPNILKPIQCMKVSYEGLPIYSSSGSKVISLIRAYKDLFVESYNIASTITPYLYEDVNDIEALRDAKWLLHIKGYGFVCNAVMKALACGVPVIMDSETWENGFFGAYVHHDENAIVLPVEQIKDFLGTCSPEQYDRIKKNCVMSAKQYHCA